jgi:hypothetical protein
MPPVAPMTRAVRRVLVVMEVSLGLLVSAGRSRRGR